MAGFAPFGRDDQPLLDVRIIGGKRVEIAVDQYGRPLDNNKKVQETQSRFSRSLSEGNSVNSLSPRSTAVPPWVRGETPPKKVLRPLESPTSTRQSSWSSSLPGSPTTLPPITRKHLDYDGQKTEVIKDERDPLSEIITAQVQGMDTNALKDVYLELCGLDSTLTGFVDAEQVEQAFARCGIPINGKVLQNLNSRFMSARRPNWVNYEQLLKFVNNIVKGEKKRDVHVPRLDLSSNPGDLARNHLPQNSQHDREIPLKPNEISPRSVNDGSLSGRQSVMVVKRAFQDRQDAHLLIEMERMLKQVPRVRDVIWKLQETLEQNDPRNNIINSQKLKTYCLRHHLPFNGSLLDKILDRLDPRGTGRVNWEEFMAFVERAVPIDAITSQASSAVGSRGSIEETPPLQPTWETRKPLRAVPERSSVITETAVIEQEQMYDEQQKNLDLQLKEQSQELAEILNRQQREIDKRQKSLHTDHISEYEHLGRELDEGSVERMMSRKVPLSQEDLEEQHRNLVRLQVHLIEQKRKIQKEQEELEKVLHHDGEHKAGYDDAESPIQRFLRLANALFLSDDKNSGFVDIESTRRLVKNYNLVYQLDFTSDIIEDAISMCSTPDGMVSVDHLLNELKRYI